MVEIKENKDVKKQIEEIEEKDDKVGDYYNKKGKFTESIKRKEMNFIVIDIKKVV